MSAQSSKELSSLLEQLTDLKKNALEEQTKDEGLYQLLEDISKICLEDVVAENADMITSTALDEQTGILKFLSNVSSNQSLRRSTLAALDLLRSITRKYGSRIKNDVNKIKDVCIQVYTKSNTAAVKSQSLECFVEILKSDVLGGCCEELPKVAKRFIPDLTKPETQVKATVKKEILLLLGVMCSTSPSSMKELSDSLAEKIISTLNYQMNRVKAPETSLIAGCFQSLYYLLIPFDRSAFPEQVKIIFNCLAKAIDSSIKTTRYEVPRSALDLLARHGEQFRAPLLASYKVIYERLVTFSMHANPDVKKAANAASETFLRQIGTELADPMDDAMSEDHRKDIFNYFLKDFMSRIRPSSSSMRSISQAIRSYGYFAGAFRKFQGEIEVRDMLTVLIEKCFQVCTTDDETSDSKATYLPSFLQSLASIVKQIDMVDEGVLESLRVIFRLTLEYYPKLEGTFQKSCGSAIIQFIYTVCAMKNRPIKLLSDLVYQALIQTCNHDPVVEGEQKNMYADDGSKVVTYKEYVPLWTDILSPRKYMSIIAVFGISELESYIYGEIVKSLLRICSKLDLTITSEKDGNAENHNVQPNEPVKVKDFQILINLADFMRTVLEEAKTELFSEWTFTFCHSIIKLSSLKPSVSSFYKLLTSAMVICSANGYFNTDPEEDEDAMDILADCGGAASSMTHQLISKHQKKVITCMKQYKDDLLISCLKFLFSLPIPIIKSNLDATSEALQMGLSLGLSYPPLIGQCLQTLRLLFNSLSTEELVPQLKVLLPYLDQFLQSSDHIDDGNVVETTRKVLKNKQRLKLPPSLLRLANEKTHSVQTEVQKLKLEVIKFLGELGGESNHHVISSDKRALAKLTVSWDTQSYIFFGLPFKEVKAELYLDKFLPRACELALSSGNRQTKVAACELVHSLVLLLLGNQIGKRDKVAEKIYRKLFPVLLNLAVDMEQVAKQLFEPLMLQLIHWFTKDSQNKETGLLLDTLMQGVETINNHALRDFSARCIAEYLEWSIKQTSEEQQRKNPENVKRLLRQMYSMARHPSFSKRLGACHVYNNIYKILREEESLVDKFTVEILVCFTECLALAHADDPSLGTHTEAKKCLNHLERVLKAKSALFLAPSKQRRCPVGWTNCTLKDVVLWLFDQVGRPETECRHACMELITNLTPSLSAEMNSKHKLMDYILKKLGMPYIKDRCEAKPTTKDGILGLSQLTSPFLSEDSMSVKVCVRWFDRILACLDAYCWLIGTEMVNAGDLLTGTESIFTCLSHFITDVSMKSLADINPKQAFTPLEIEEYNRAKCTVTVRTFDFVTIMTAKGKQVLLHANLFNTKFWSLFGSCTVNPVEVGFNMADIEILSNLPKILEGLLRMAKRFLTVNELNTFYKAMKSLLGRDGSYHLYKISESLDLRSTEESQLFCTYVTSGYQLLSDCSVLTQCLASDVGEPQLAIKLADAVQLVAKKHKVLEPTARHLLETMYRLALSMGLPAKSVTDMLFSDGGTLVYSFVETVLLTYLTGSGTNLIRSIAGHAESHPHMTSSYIIGLLDYCRTKVDLKDSQKQKVAGLVIDSWQCFESWWNVASPNSATLTYCICIIRKFLVLDSSIEKKKHYADILKFFVKLINSTDTEQSQRYDLLDMLPMFLNGTAEQRKIIRDCIQNYVNNRFPLNSSGLSASSAGFHDYITAFSKILEAMVTGSDLDLLQVVLTIICREEIHAREDIVQEYVRRFAIRLRKLQTPKQLEALTICFSMFMDTAVYGNQTIRVAALSRVCLPILHRADKITIVEFFKQTMGDIKRLLGVRESKGSPDALEVIVKDKICCYNLVEFMYNSLMKEEVFSAGSTLAQIWVSQDPTAAGKADSWKNMTKDLIRMTKDCKNEDMRGEMIHLESRRKLHCAAFNALIAIISNTQVNPDFYRSFIFSGDTVKGCAPLENICPEVPYVFEVELTNLPVRTKKLVSVRKLREDGGETSDTIVYMQSVAESSLTEDLSRYDFSYSSQSLANSRLRREEKEQEQLELLYPDKETVQPRSTNISEGYVELESDALNEHECMASFTSLLQHMMRNDITPSVADEIDDIPAWMLWLKQKIESSSVPVNVKHFIARMILNNEAVFKPFSRHWLAALVQYVTCCCEQLHYFAMDVIVMIIVWCDDVTPQNNAVGKAMLNNLVEFIMSKAHHDRKGIFRNNLDLLKNCLERWKGFLTVNTKVIFDYLKSTNDKEVLTGVQILGVLIANKVDPFNASRSGSVGKQEFYSVLANGMTNRLLSVYSSASEVIGLTLSYLSSKEEEADKQFALKYEEFVEKGLSLPSIPIHKFVVCLYSIQLHYQSFCDRFMTKMLFEIRRLHGDMRQKGLEIIASRIAYVDAPFQQLSNISFDDLLTHRNSHLKQSCLKIFHNVLGKLTADQIWTWLPLVSNSQSSAACRQISHSICMAVYTKFKGTATSSDSVSKLISLAQENLLLALSDESQANRLIVQNFWSGDNTLSDQIHTRLQAILTQMYSPRTEKSFLSYATNLILELTSKSSDFNHTIFPMPLSDCKFENYAVNATWSQRFSTLAPMFADGTASQSVSSLGPGMLRGTLAPQQFTATQQPDDSTGQKAFDWLTQSSLDASLDISATPSESSSLLFTVGTTKSKPPRTQSGRGKLNPAHRGKDEVDSRTVATQSSMELSALRRRFIKDQESSRIYFAKRESRRKRLEEEKKLSGKSQRENQVTLYREYRIGDLPDIQIKYSAVISPLQALAQKDSVTARMLFIAVFNAVLRETNSNEETMVIQLVENILKQSVEYHSPLMACLMELLADLSKKTEPVFISTTVSDCSIQCKQEPVGVVTLESKLMSISNNHTAPKRKKIRTIDTEDSQTWVDLARLYKSMGCYDIVRSIISENISNIHTLTKEAVELESRASYTEACSVYERILNDERDSLEGSYELSLIDDGRLYCMEQLSNWDDMEATLLANLENNLSGVWADSSKDLYLKSLMKCGTRKLMAGENRSEFLKFINESCRVKERSDVLEIGYSEELAIIWMTKKEFSKARFCYQRSMDKFLSVWSTLDQLMVDAKSHNVQSLQKLTEMGEFLDIICHTVDEAAASELVSKWISRSPGELCSTSTWDDITTNRIFYMNILENNLGSDLFLERRLSMRLSQATHAVSQGNLNLSSYILHDIYREVEGNDVDLQLRLRWSAAGVMIRQRQANAADIALPSRIKHVRAAMRAMDKFSDSEVDAVVKPDGDLYYQWYSLKNKSWSCLLSGVLESTEGEMVESNDELVQLAGCASIDEVLTGISQSALGYIQKSMSTEVSSQIASAHMDMVTFADQILRYAEEGGDGKHLAVKDLLVLELRQNVITSCTRALNLGSENALGWVPRLLQLIELYPDVVSLFIEQTKGVPCWMFICWISQMVAMLDNDNASAVHHIISGIAKEYPMALIYPFKISQENFTFKSGGKETATAKKFVQRLKDTMSRYPIVDSLIRALEQLSQPNALFADWVDEVIGLLSSKTKSAADIEKSYTEMYKCLFDHRDADSDSSLYERYDSVDRNTYRIQFAKAFADKVENFAGKKGKNIIGMSTKDFRSKATQFKEQMKDMVKGKNGKLKAPGLLKDYSTWLTRFNSELMACQLEIPGQYGKIHRKPLPEHHVILSGFDDKVSVLDSLRMPKKIVMRGNDEREYSFLVKGGEDLRLDQRIQAVFTSMNTIMGYSSNCQQLSLATYNVIPMNTRLGLIEWMENVVTLKNVVTNAQTSSEQRKTEAARRQYSERYAPNFSSVSGKSCGDWFTGLVAALPNDLLRRSLHSMSRSLESYYMLREQCITSHAVICVSHYLLGIGDRHLSNFMMDTESGAMVGIDFGYSFGTSTSLLPIPELVPFRLTGQFIQLMSPYGTHGLFERTMVNVLRLMRENRRQLLNMLDIFIKEPSLDWMQNSTKQLKRAELDDATDTSDIQQASEKSADWYPREKVKFAKLKLLGAHPRYITAEEFQLNRNMKNHLSKGLAHILPDPSVTKDIRLSVEKQVAELISHATDPNLLGRIFVGWEPYM